MDFASIQGGHPQRGTVDTEDPIQVAFNSSEATRAGLLNTARIDAIDPRQYEADFLVGGQGTMRDFPESQSLAKLVASHYEAGGAVGSVSLGPTGLLDVELANRSHLVAGRRVAAFTKSEEAALGKEKIVPFMLADRFQELGAGQKQAADFAENVVVDERLVTGQNQASAAGVAKDMEKLLAETIHLEKAEEQHEHDALHAEKDTAKKPRRLRQKG